MAQQAQGETDRIAEAERGRSAALQEAAFYRAKLAALESNSPGEVSRLERDRSAQLEHQLSDALRESAELERQASTLREQAKLEQQLRSSAEERLSETAKRAMAAEAAQMKAYDELAALQKRTHASESLLREHSERVTTLTSLVARHKSDHDSARGQLDEASSAVQRHLLALEQTQSALAAANARASEHERLYHSHRDQSIEHQNAIVQLRSDLEAKTAEANTHASRAAELEVLVARHRDEAETHRTAASGGLAELLAHKQQDLSRSRDAEIPAHVDEKMRALEEEAQSLRDLHGQARGVADSATNALQELQERNNSLEKQHVGLRSELSAMRSQLAIALQEVARLKDHSSGKELELRDLTRSAETAQVKASLLKQFMADRGISVPDDEELSAKSGFADRRIRDLEMEIDARTREIQDAEHRLQDSESRVEELTREVEHQRSERSSRGLGGAGDGNGVDASVLFEAEQKAEAAERELAETTASYKERMAQLENDYQTAVQFVKGTEKMLRRMKDELTKYKNENATLQSELAAARQGAVPDDDTGAAEAARDIEALRSRLSDVTLQSEEIAQENRELERRLAALISEQKDASDRNRDLEDGKMDTSRKMEELESEVEKLEGSLGNVRKELQETLALNQHLSSELTKSTRERGAAPDGAGGAGASDLSRDLSAAQSANDQLKSENANLAQRLQDVEDKVSSTDHRAESSAL